MIHTSANEDSDRPDIEILQLALAFNIDYGYEMAEKFNFDKETYDRVFGPHEHKSCITLLPSLLRPRSRSNVKLQSADYK